MKCPKEVLKELRMVKRPKRPGLLAAPVTAHAACWAMQMGEKSLLQDSNLLMGASQPDVLTIPSDKVIRSV